MPATALKPGRNVLAAEVHQINAVSSDLFFDLQLTASDELPVVRVNAAARDVALVRGNHGTVKDFDGHAWNELTLPDGEKVIVDVMNPRPGFRFPPTTDRVAADYLTVKNEPYYAQPKVLAASAAKPAPSPSVAR